MIKERTLNIIFSFSLFIFLIGFAFLISFWFGLFFIFGFLFAFYTGKLKKNPYKPTLIFIGGLIVRFSLERFVNIISNYSLTLDFIVAFLMVFLLFFIGWKVKRI
jgi:hypothetical protein